MYNCSVYLGHAKSISSLTDSIYSSYKAKQTCDTRAQLFYSNLVVTAWSSDICPPFWKTIMMIKQQIDLAWPSIKHINVKKGLDNSASLDT